MRLLILMQILKDFRVLADSDFSDAEASDALDDSDADIEANKHDSPFFRC